MSEPTAIMRKVMALLAKAEATDHAAEAEAYYAKASELMLKHAIDEASLRADVPSAVTAVHDVEIGKGRPDHLLMSAVGRPVGVRIISFFGKGTVSLFGLPTEIEYTQRSYASLLIQRERFLAVEPRPPYESVRSFNHSFRVHFAQRMSERLQQAREDVTRDAGSAGALVLVSRDAQVEEALREAFPRAGSYSVRTSSLSGATAGRHAANRADPSGGRRTLSSSPRQEIA